MDRKTYRRMLTERANLFKRCNSLSAFILSDEFGELSEGEQIMLREQLQAMLRYYHVLFRRIIYYAKKVKKNEN